MGLFDKKYCDVCGAKIGFLGNRKLEDGNLCKDCAGKLSPFFSDRRNSTIAEIKEQLAYRKENEQRLADFSPSVTFDGSKNVYIDPISERFIVTGLSNWRSGNPDLINLSQVRNVETDIRENKEEIFYKDSEGNEKSYEPRRYECDYEFNVTIHVDSPWFDEIELELSDGNRPDRRFTDLYRAYEQKMHELADILMRRNERFRVLDGDGMMKQIRAEDELSDSLPVSQPSGEWVCPSCGAKSSGAKFCENCGDRSAFDVYHWIYLMELVSLVPQYAILLAVYMLNVVQNNILIFSVIAVKGLLCLIIRFQVDSLMRSRYRNGK